MKRLLIAAVSFFWPCSYSYAGEESLLEVVPRHVRLSVSVQNLDAVREQGDKLIAALGQKDRFPFSLSRLIDMGLDFLNIRSGVDRKGTFSIVMADWGDQTDRDREWKNLVLRIPYTDADAMAENWKLPAGSLKPGNVHEVTSHLRRNENAYLGADGAAAYLGFLSSSVQSVIDSEKLSAVKFDDESNRIAQADVLFHVHVPLYLNDESGKERLLKSLDDLVREIGGTDDESQKTMLSEIALGSEELLVAVQIDEGINVRAQLTLSESLPDQAKQLLAGLTRAAGSGPTLNGLPNGNLLVAAARSANRAKRSVIVRSLVEWLLQTPLLGTAAPENLYDLLQPSHDTLMGVFNEVYNSLDESRMAVYLNDDPASQGLITVLAIVRPRDGESFQQTLQDILKYSRGTVYNPETKLETAISEKEIRGLIEQLGADDFRTRSSATLKLKLLGEPTVPQLKAAAESTDREVRRRAAKLLKQIQESVDERRRVLAQRGILEFPTPRFVMYPSHETVAGYRADLIEARWKAADEDKSNVLHDWFGPRGREILMVRAGDRVVFCFGSDRELLMRCLNGIRKENVGLESDAALFRKYDGPARNAEMHFSLQRVSRIFPRAVNGNKVPTIERPPTHRMTSMGFEISPRHVRTDVTIPVDELRILGLFFGIW